MEDLEPHPGGPLSQLLPLLLLSISAPAFACEPEALRQTFPDPGTQDARPAMVSFTLEQNSLRGHFDIKSDSIFGKRELGANEFPYMFDVAEVFISAEGGTPYYEFELSSFGQTLEVKILDPKKPFKTGLHMGVETKVARNTNGWTADFDIPLDRLNWKGDPTRIVGNAYVILGKKPNRKFYSRSLPVQTKPNFHHPEFFEPLLKCTPSPAE